MADFKISVTGFEELAGLVQSFKSAAPVAVNKIQQIVKAKGEELHSIIKSNSPVGQPSDSRNYPGYYRDSWRVSYANPEGTIAGFKIWNSAIQAEAIELGSAPGQWPWPNPTVGRQAGGRGMTKSGRTIYSSGRIWSTQAIGGVFDRSVKDSDVDALVSSIENAVEEVITAL